jgi:hypothetical protein
MTTMTTQKSFYHDVDDKKNDDFVPACNSSSATAVFLKTIIERIPIDKRCETSVKRDFFKRERGHGFDRKTNARTDFKARERRFTEEEEEGGEDVVVSFVFIIVAGREGNAAERRERGERRRESFFARVFRGERGAFAAWADEDG